SILNDATNRQNLKAVLTLSGDNYGKIGEATKKDISIAPNMNFTFTNKEFTSYDVASNGSFFEKAVKTGTLPSDVYTYQIDIYNDLGVKIGSGMGKNTIMNQLSKPELVSPGNDFSRQPEALRVKQPLFQWFSQGNEFEFALYEVNSGQKTGEEVVLNRPVYKTVIKSTSLQYPASAEMLVEGKTYAWQVKMLTVGSGGNNALSSDVFWFKYTASGALQTIVSSIKLTPDDGFVQVGQSIQIIATAFTADNAPIKDPSIEWKVIPADAGSIDQKGLFTAGPKAGSCAIVAKNGDIQEYSTINIIGANSNDASIKIMMQKLFGIPTK
ncbi:MAG: hypothetical protein HYZ42_01670, partial [Bacteroidetes bacterium]|nr:hypothetical protein [Bacteroidota bacterium]